MLKREDIEYLSTLARLEVSESEKDSLAGQLDSVLSYVGEISRIATNGGETSAAGELRNVVREDEQPNKGGEYTDAIIANAPKTENGYVKVKRIM